MDWIKESKLIFNTVKPEHFTDYAHCKECAEHDETLRRASVGSIGMEQLGNGCWDPMSFCSAEGMKYYLPALVRLSLETIYTNDPYFELFLFHLEYDGENNEFLQDCTEIQRAFIVSFIEYLIDSHDKEIEANDCTDNILRAHEIWINA